MARRTRGSQGVSTRDDCFAGKKLRLTKSLCASVYLVCDLAIVIWRTHIISYVITRKLICCFSRVITVHCYLVQVLDNQCVGWLQKKWKKATKQGRKWWKLELSITRFWVILCPLIAPCHPKKIGRPIGPSSGQGNGLCCCSAVTPQVFKNN